MTTQRVVALVAVVLVLTAGTAAAFVVGLGPFATSDDESDIGTFPTETSTPSGGDGAPSNDSSGAASGGSGNGGSDGGDGGDGATGDDAARTRPPFTFRVTDTEKCGRTCRDVTVRLSNNMDRTATDVTVYTRIFAGNSTAQDDRVWQGREDIGRLEGGETVTRTKRVTLSLTEGFAVQQNDGWITIQTTVQSADQTRTFTERRDVT